MQPEATVQAKATKAIERRFGKSLMPYSFKCVRPDASVKLWRITDIESGSWLEFVHRYGRLQVHREHDGASL